MNHRTKLLLEYYARKRFFAASIVYQQIVEDENDHLEITS